MPKTAKNTERRITLLCHEIVYFYPDGRHIPESDRDHVIKMITEGYIMGELCSGGYYGGWRIDKPASKTEENIMRENGHTFSLTEINGENEYSWDYFIDTEDYKKAIKHAYKLGKEWYGEVESADVSGMDNYNHNQCYLGVFDFDFAIVKISFPYLSTKKNYLDQLFTRYSITLKKIKGVKSV